jgi:hypothetical protein
LERVNKHYVIYTAGRSKKVAGWNMLHNGRDKKYQQNIECETRREEIT